MRTVKGLVLAAAAALALAGCGSAADEPAPATTGGSVLAAYDLEGLDARQVIDRLESTPVDARARDLRASVRPGQLLLTDSRTGASTALDLPAGQFYLSIAPYVGGTHDCFNHSLTTCRGELATERMHLTVTDRATGRALVDQDVQTFDSGFAGFWLPSGIDATVRVDHDGRTATADVSTGPDDPTCLTTMRLS
ncbi:CueP family metal-binding protein [Phytohabitans sp. ZYX-F-186]|uniref:CueP family metal-binding protein n=1 Tax=Phytohabitans maris TaxID=3071409 RepID=A0ABU0ZQV9_9ACTN|nr:CueP family metal-binding protein [Phytohabitans sp. ZYX-F-186]MDQ7909419.1 CueP family metal-binding protein [Phytohabitans sp. ZYX-F-186]